MNDNVKLVNINIDKEEPLRDQYRKMFEGIKRIQFELDDTKTTETTIKDIVALCYWFFPHLFDCVDCNSGINKYRQEMPISIKDYIVYININEKEVTK